MSTFDLHPKLFLTNGTIKTTGTSANLNAGELGLYNVNTHQVVTVANAASHPAAYIAQGSYYPTDKIAKVQGGYKESIKSPAFTKGINPKNVTRWYKVAPTAAVSQVVRMFYDGTTTGTGPTFLCGKQYFLRLEAKGEPVLRFINRYIYKHFAVRTACCANDCSAPCTDEAVDAATVMWNYANQINIDPLFSNFVVARAITKSAASLTNTTVGSAVVVVASATGIAVGQRVIGAGIPFGATVVSISGLNITLSIVATATATAVPTTYNTVVSTSYVSPVLAADKALVVAGLEVEVVYSETVFGDCSFNQADYVNDQFIEILGSMVYQNGDICESGEVVMNHSTGAGWTEVRAFNIPEGLGEFVLREYIASQNQSGIFFSHDPRSRETSNNTALSAVDRTANYFRYYMIYNVAVKGNASNTLSQDQYILCFAIKQGLPVTNFEALFAAWFAALNPAITLEILP